MSLRSLAIASAIALASFAAHAAQVDVDAFTRNDKFNNIKLSPGGQYLAATVPLDDRTLLAILDRASNKVTATVKLGQNVHVQNFWWVNDQRVVLNVAEKYGALDTPQLDGNLYAINADGGSGTILAGWKSGEEELGSHIHSKKKENVAAYLVDDLPNDDKRVLVGIVPTGQDPYMRVDVMDVDSGKRVTAVRAPIRNADFVADNAGVVRFAVGADIDNTSRLYYRADDHSDWKVVNDELASGVVQTPLGFAADDSVAYIESEQVDGPDVILAYDTATGKETRVLGDKVMSPAMILTKPGTNIPVGAMFVDGKGRTEFFDPASPEARLYRSLEAAFPDERPYITSATRDGRLYLVRTYSDANPGDYYLFDAVAKKADHVVSQADWVDPDAMGPVRAIQFTARDGLAVKGYLTLPRGASGKNLPMVVLPHGGPFGISDDWGFDPEAQLLASVGYAVLQLNYRGSGERGRKYEHAGAAKWGDAMQDDVTDGTHWAIQQGIADPSRICIYGASYGAYAALMGVAKEPSLYKCAAGYVGVYDLPQLHGEETSKRGAIRTWANEWIGSDMDALAAHSPTRLAAKIKVPVFLAAGREDPRAPVAHTERMEKALKDAGVPVESLYYDGEGHGFYKPEHRREFYTRLLAFLSRSLGGATAAPASAPAAK